MATKRILQNNRLLWLSNNLDKNQTHTQQTLEKLATIVHHIDLFTQVDDCLRFLDEVTDERAFIITSGSLGQQLVKSTCHLPQVNTIYVFSSNSEQHQSWSKDWPKIRGVYSRLKPLCEALRIAVEQTNAELTTNQFHQSE